MSREQARCVATRAEAALRRGSQRRVDASGLPVPISRRGAACGGDGTLVAQRGAASGTGPGAVSVS